MKITMNKTLLLLCILSFCCSCNSSTETNETQQVPIPPQQPVELNVSLNMTQLETKLGMPITLRFVLTNNNTEEVTFCKLNSPANERVWTDCFRISDAQGNLVPYIGSTPNHSGPVEDHHMMTIEGEGIRLYTIDVRTLYQLDKPGKYSIRFAGDKINLLPASLPANFIITA